MDAQAAGMVPLSPTNPGMSCGCLFSARFLQSAQTLMSADKAQHQQQWHALCTTTPTPGPQHGVDHTTQLAATWLLLRLNPSPEYAKV